MTKHGSLLVVAMLATAALAAAPAQAALTVDVVNDSAQQPGDVYVMLDGGSSSDGQLANDTPVLLSALNGGSFTLSQFSGRAYFSYGAPVAANETNTSTTRFDKVELTYGPTSVYNPSTADLTAVDFFGIPFSLSAANGSTSLGTMTEPYADTLFTALEAIPGSSSALVGTTSSPLRFLSPQDSPSSFPSMAAYVQSMAGQTITIQDAFYGTPFTTVTYTGTFAADGSITLNGTSTTWNGSTSTGTQAGQPLAVTGANLVSSIYPASGAYTVGGQPDTANDLYGVIYRDLMAGFAWGYWGSTYGNNTNGWCTSPDPRGFCLGGWNKPAFAAARTTAPAFTAYNPYAAVIAANTSTAYGFSFADTGAASPLLNISNATTLTITIGADSASESSAGMLAGGKLLDAAAVPARATVGASAVATVGRAACPSVCGTVTHTATARIGGQRVRVGRGRAVLEPGDHRRLALKVTHPGARALLRHGHALKVRLAVSVRHTSGRTTHAARTVVLRPKG